MKTTDSVMRESEIELLEKTVEDIMVESSCEPDGERLWVKTSYELADLCRPIISHSLAEAEKKAYKKGWADAEKNLAKIMGVANKMIDGLKNYRPLTGDNPERKV